MNQGCFAASGISDDERNTPFFAEGIFQVSLQYLQFIFTCHKYFGLFDASRFPAFGDDIALQPPLLLSQPARDVPGYDWDVLGRWGSLAAKTGEFSK